MNRPKVYLPLDYIPQSCMECGGLKNISQDHIPRYKCISKNVIFAIEDYDWMTKERMESCPLIMAEDIKWGIGNGREVGGVHPCSEEPGEEDSTGGRRMRTFTEKMWQKICGKEGL